MSGWILLFVGLVVGTGEFAIGYRFSRAGRDLLGPATVDEQGRTPQDRRLVGRLIMLTAPIILLVLPALAVGLIPPGAIEPITIGSAR